MTRTITILAVAAGAALSTAAHADPVRLGIGANANWDAFAGGDLTLDAASSLGVLELGLGYDHQTDGDELDQRTTSVSLAILPALVHRGPVTLEAGVRVTIDRARVDGVYPIPSYDAASVSAPIRIEYAVTSWLSLHAEADVHVFTGDRMSSDDVHLAIVPPASYLTGFTLWF